MAKHLDRRGMLLNSTALGAACLPGVSCAEVKETVSCSIMKSNFYLEMARARRLD